jgi:8-oxo-dGTP pyrophosphatase MutT (NUDIX family)
VYVTRDCLAAVEVQFGLPHEVKWRHTIDEDERRLIVSSQKDGRAHDITLFIFDGDRLALIRKPGFPPGAYRTPSGGVKRGEDVEGAAKREAWEETGLLIELKRYILRIRVDFICGAVVIPWTSHVFTAQAIGGMLGTHDPQEIDGVCYATVEELQGGIRRALWESGRSLLRYRVKLTDAVIERLKTREKLLTAENAERRR